MSNLAEERKILTFPNKKVLQEKEVVVADLDNGFTRVANTLVDAFCRVKFSDQEHRVLFAVIRKTFGYQQSSDWVALEQISEMTGMKKPHVSKTLKTLIERNILVKDGKKLGVNTVISEWSDKPKVTQTGNKSYLNRQQKKLPKQVTEITQIGNAITQIGNVGYLNRQPQKKETNTKEIIKDITHNSVDAESQNSVPVAKQKKTQIKKPQAFKDLFSLYPAIRKGGTDSAAWQAWKSEKLTEQDAELALKWLRDAAQANSDWGTYSECQYVKGIVRFIRERIWLTPLPVKYQQAAKHNLSIQTYSADSTNDYSDYANDFATGEEFFNV